MPQGITSPQKRIQVFAHTIRENFPELDVRKVEKLGRGWMNEAVLVNEEWVFRFPLQQEGAEALEKEIIILPHLAHRITLAIPQFDFIGQQRNGLPFVGYKKLPGEILGETEVLSLSAEEQDMVARQIATFIDELSAFPIAQARALGMLETDFYQEFTDHFKAARQHVFPLVNQEMQQYLAARFETYLGHPEHFQYRPTLIHADLSPNHYLMDPQKRSLTSIIDFGDIQIGDPDYEYLYMLEDGGEAFTRRVMAIRGQSDLDKRLAKIAYFITFDHVDLVLEGIHRGHQAWINAGIKAIREEMNR